MAQQLPARSQATLHRQYTVVARFFQVIQSRREVGVSAPGDEAIRVGQVDMRQEITGRPHGPDHVGLLQVHVEEIGHDLHVRQIDPAGDRAALGQGIDEVRLVAVQAFDHQVHPRLGGVLTEAL